MPNKLAILVKVVTKDKNFSDSYDQYISTINILTKEKSKEIQTLIDSSPIISPDGKYAVFRGDKKVKLYDIGSNSIKTIFSDTIDTYEPVLWLGSNGVMLRLNEHSELFSLDIDGSSFSVLDLTKAKPFQAR